MAGALLHPMFSKNKKEIPSSTKIQIPLTHK